MLLSHQKNQKMHFELYKTLFVKKRLDLIAERLSKPVSSEEKSSFLFTPEERIEGFDTVCFSYPGLTDPDPAFNGTLRSLLYLNSSKELCLSTWATGKDPRIEILLPNIKSYSLVFFDPQTNEWKDRWPAHFSHLPVWMRLHIKADESLEFLFRISQSSEPILYVEGL